jgi:hypothetical protein
MPEPHWERPWEGRPLVLRAHRREAPEEPDGLREAPNSGRHELEPLARPGRRGHQVASEA